MLELNKNWKWKPPEVKTVAAEQVGGGGPLEQIKSHLEYLRANDLWTKEYLESFRASLGGEYKGETLDKVLRCAIKDGVLDVMLDEMLKGKSDPVTCARELVRKYL